MDTYALTAKPESRPLFSRDTLARLILPLVVEQLLLMTVGMADTLMVTTAGEAAVSGVSLVDNINLLMIQVFAALSTGGAVVVSQYLGRQDSENACAAAKQLLYVATAVALILMAVGLVFRRHILCFIFGTLDDDVMDSALIYFLLTAAAYPFIAVYNAGAALFRSMGNSKVSMFCSLLVNFVNIALNALLIYGYHWGAAGAGVGTLVSRITAAVIVLALLHHPEQPVHLEGGLTRPIFLRSMVRRILGIGIPNGVENGMFQVGKLLVLSLISSFGTAATAANAIANSIASVLNVPGTGIYLGLITVVAQCIGADEYGQAVSYTKKLMLTAYAAMDVLCVLLFFFAQPLVGCFHLSAEAAAMATQVLRWNSLFAGLFWPMSFALPNALRAAGDAKFTMIVSMISMWVFRIGFSYLLAWAMNWRLLGVWIAMFIDWVVRSIVFPLRFHSGVWKKKRVI